MMIDDFDDEYDDCDDGEDEDEYDDDDDEWQTMEIQEWPPNRNTAQNSHSFYQTNITKHKYVQNTNIKNSNT